MSGAIEIGNSKQANQHIGVGGILDEAFFKLLDLLGPVADRRCVTGIEIVHASPRGVQIAFQFIQRATATNAFLHGLSRFVERFGRGQIVSLVVQHFGQERMRPQRIGLAGRTDGDCLAIFEFRPHKAAALLQLESHEQVLALIVRVELERPFGRFLGQSLVALSFAGLSQRIEQHRILLEAISIPLGRFVDDGPSFSFHEPAQQLAQRFAVVGFERDRLPHRGQGFVATMLMLQGRDFLPPQADYQL